MRKYSLIAGGFLLVAAMLVMLLPWTSFLEKQVRTRLENSGISVARLNVSGLGLSGIVLDDIAFGGTDPLTLRNVVIGYSFAGLKRGALDSLVVNDLSILVQYLNGRWVISGLENFIKPAEGSRPLSVTSINQMLENLPFRDVKIKNGVVKVKTDSWQASLPLDITINNHDSSKISIEAKNINFQIGKVNAVLAEVAATLDLDHGTQMWRGSWQAKNVVVEGVPELVAPLQGEGTIKAALSLIATEGVLTNTEKTQNFKFRHEQSFDSALPSRLTILSAVTPWKQGRLSVKDVGIPLGTKESVTFPLALDQVSIDELLGALTGQKVTATGVVSGTLPITIKKDGNLIFGQGVLKAAGPGSINLPPDAIPGDNEQIVIVRKILENLDYTALSITMASDSQNNLGILMSIEGHNPDVYNGRAVKLNVNLTGEVLDFIQQNIMLLQNPQSLWEQGTSE